ncbi:MAG: YdeI/OmpD-associated family protein [Pseudomonadota bacterium]|uniref:YdeI/OmpD-associated family protein n=1 Tax=unclassified Phenylobacterium TaxID=2640670 RepID=UPI000A5877B0|nr:MULTISPECIES: YdeI/OmpD-associated family protein [unclassified Phenylobacterium]MBT9473514.1 YdeI/OmpD-associated family protein [Phenylobacterium sp.]
MTLIRTVNPMTAFVRDALAARNLTAAYEARPPFQRNDYLGWIGRARTDTTRQKRLAQMLDELEDGDVYMKVRWKA